MNIDFNRLLVDPFEMGRFSMHYSPDDICLGITDHFLNNVYSEDEFKEQIGTSYFLDEWSDVASEMGIRVEDVPVYDVQGNLTNRNHSDYIDGVGKGQWTNYLIVDHYMKYKLIKLLSDTTKRINEGTDVKKCIDDLKFMFKYDF